MENKTIELRPAPVYAFLKCWPFLLLTLLFLFLSWRISASFTWFGLASSAYALYRYIHIRKVLYLVTQEYIRINSGIFFKRTDQVELYRVKDYIITQPPLMQLFRLMNVTLKCTDSENPVLNIMGIPHTDLIDIIRERVQEARKNNRIYEIN